MKDNRNRMLELITKIDNSFKAYKKNIDKKHITENHIRLVTMFNNSTINENDENKRNAVILAIKNNDWEEHNPQRYYESINKSKHKEMLTNYTVDEFNNMKLFKLNGYDIGYALKKFNDKGFSEIVAVYNNEPDVKNVGKELIQSAINNGGCYLDHYDGFLSNLYQSMGFEEYDRYKFDPQYDVDGNFRKKYGEADVIFRKHRNCK